MFLFAGAKLGAGNHEYLIQRQIARDAKRARALPLPI